MSILFSTWSHDQLDMNLEVFCPTLTGCWLLHLNPFPAKRSRVTQLVQHIMHRPMGPWLLCRSGVPSKVPAGLGGLPYVVMMKCILWHLRAWLLISTVQWTSQDSKLNRACDKYLTTIKHSFYHEIIWNLYYYETLELSFAVGGASNSVVRRRICISNILTYWACQM